MNLTALKSYSLQNKSIFFNSRVGKNAEIKNPEHYAKLLAKKKLQHHKQTPMKAEIHAAKKKFQNSLGDKKMQNSANTTPATHKILTCLVLIASVTSFITMPAVAQAEKSVETLRDMGKTFAAIAQNASDAVVGIEASKIEKQDMPSEGLRQWDQQRQSPFENDPFEFFFRRRFPRRFPQEPRRSRAFGSGFIISEDGYILTNNHLVEKAEDDKVYVTLSDKREFEAEIIGTDPASDVAVVKIDAGDLPTVELGDSDSIEVGEWVLAIGNPLGLTWTVTAGIVSAKNRSGLGVTKYEDFIQTDAAINFGNSGGPLLNIDGKVIGINTAIVSRGGGNIGIGLAIPINLAKSAFEQLKETGRVARGFLGVGIEDLTPALAESLDLEATKGVVVTEVMEDTPAKDAGFEVYDVIVELNGREMETANQLRDSVSSLKPGTEVEIVIIRDGDRKELETELGERAVGIEARGRGGYRKRSEPAEALGFRVEEFTSGDRGGMYEGLSGVIVSYVKPGSPAERAGLRKGMLIMEVDRTEVESVQEFNEEIEEAGEDGTVLLLVHNGRYNQLMALKVKD